MINSSLAPLFGNYQTDRLTRGYLGLQNHDNHAVVKFRNIRITEL